MALQVYRRKRDFAVTPEPRGSIARATGGRYVIQKHDATRLHYDLRLELDGVMKSWAVTRGPSLVAGEKRLAIHVEDHPVAYNSFEGTIPEGQYGGGTVMVWDRGQWIPHGDPHKAYRKGHLIFVLEGEKLKGRWHLVRMRRRADEKQDPWLLIKADDEEARSAIEPDVLEEMPLSAATGRSLAEIAAGRGGKRVWQSNRNGDEQKMAKTVPEKTAASPVARRRERAPRHAKSSGNKSSANKAAASKARSAKKAKSKSAKKSKRAGKSKRAKPAAGDPLRAGSGHAHHASSSGGARHGSKSHHRQQDFEASGAAA
jgi:bifunctional non-homologous end joining protein LigD